MASENICFPYQWNPETGEPTAWHSWIPGDYHLQPGSPAIDAGTSEGAPASDIEGNPRPCWERIDIGAYEYCGDVPPVHIQEFRRGDSNADGRTDISDPIAILNSLFLGMQKTTCQKAGDANDDGNLDISDAVFLLSYLFLGGEVPKEPLGICGIDPTPDELTCESFTGCQKIY